MSDDVEVLDEVVVVAVPFDVVLAMLASAGSSPLWTRRARTPKTATKLAIAPAANFRALGARIPRRGAFLGGVGAGSFSAGSAGGMR